MFQWNKYPGVTVREALASELGISEASVQVRLIQSLNFSGGWGAALPRILDRGVPRRFLNPDPI